MQSMDIKELLESEEGKAAINGYIEEATKGIKSKNDELLGEVKKLKSERDDLRKKTDEAEEAKRKAEEEAVMKSGDVEKITQQLEAKYNKIIETKDSTIGEQDTTLNKLVIDSSLTSALTEAGIAPEFMSGAKALIKAAHKAERNGDVALIDGVDTKEFVSQWAQSDAGKHYIAAKDNGGGGAGGSNGGGKASGGKSWGDLKTTKEKAEYLKNKSK